MLWHKMDIVSIASLVTIILELQEGDLIKKKLIIYMQLI